MQKQRFAALVAAAYATFAASAALAAPSQDEAMRKLAAQSGCVTCHGIEAPRPGPEGVAPVGPAWIDVAKKYKGDKGAAAKLTKAVMQGSNPYDSHWKGKVSGLAMPPNEVAIKEADAKKLVSWILSLAK